MSRFVLTFDASEDLREIIEFIRKDSPNAARRVLQEFRETMRKLAQMPGMGHMRQDLADEALRFWPIYSYLIIFRPETKPLEIVRVLRGSRDVLSILSSNR
jgi:antitoxin ParD1/3/4/toxin ParE1/3/4